MTGEQGEEGKQGIISLTFPIVPRGTLSDRFRCSMSHNIHYATMQRAYIKQKARKTITFP